MSCESVTPTDMWVNRGHTGIEHQWKACLEKDSISCSDCNSEDEILLQVHLPLMLTVSMPSADPTLLQEDLPQTNIMEAGGNIPLLTLGQQ